MLESLKPGRVKQQHEVWRVMLGGALAVILAVAAPRLLADQSPGGAMAAQAAKPPVVVGDKYADLLPPQRRRVDDWVARYGTALRKPMEPAATYDTLPLSTKTTFSAVTHALHNTQLTDRSGTALGETALDLVAHLETVAGSVPGTRGDLQFRIYVQLRPDAQSTFDKSREFERRADNTIYHKGYPICYRGEGGAPSIQVSIGRDGKRADIDVDYRSSAFPVFLLNGHLTAANSDVRAGDNDQRHNQHWTGLGNWWRSFLGLPLLRGSSPDAPATGWAIALQPRLTNNPQPEAAIYDFLHAWLVEKKPDVAVGYIAPRAAACMELERGEPVDRATARVQMFQNMKAVAEKLGGVENLSQVSLGVRSAVNPRAKVIAQPHHAQFVMYNVREDLAEEFDCSNQLAAQQGEPVPRGGTVFGRYVGASFRLRAGDSTGQTILTLWARQSDSWSMTAYRIQPDADRAAVPNTMPATLPVPDTPRPTVAGEPELNRTARAFMDAWFVRRDVSATFAYLSPKCYPCYNLSRAEGRPEATSNAEVATFLREGIERVSVSVGAARRLDDVVMAVEAHHPDLRLVAHPDSRAFTLVAVPDYMGTQADCSRFARKEQLHFEPGAAPTFGNYYALAFQVKQASEGAAVLWALWAREDGAWKITWFSVETP